MGQAGADASLLKRGTEEKGVENVEAETRLTSSKKKMGHRTVCGQSKDCVREKTAYLEERKKGRAKEPQATSSRSEKERGNCFDY